MYSFYFIQTFSVDVSVAAHHLVSYYFVSLYVRSVLSWRPSRKLTAKSQADGQVELLTPAAKQPVSHKIATTSVMVIMYQHSLLTQLLYQIVGRTFLADSAEPNSIVEDNDD